MRYLVIVKCAPADTGNSAWRPTPGAAMAEFCDLLACAGVLLDAHCLQPETSGWRVRHDSSAGSPLDGPLPVSTPQFAGYALIQVSSHEEAVEWCRRFPPPPTGSFSADVELRPLAEPDLTAGARGPASRARRPG